MELVVVFVTDILGFTQDYIRAQIILAYVGTYTASMQPAKHVQ